MNIKEIQKDKLESIATIHDDSLYTATSIMANQSKVNDLDIDSLKKISKVISVYCDRQVKVNRVYYDKFVNIFTPIQMKLDYSDFTETNAKIRFLLMEELGIIQTKIEMLREELSKLSDHISFVQKSQI